MVKLKTKDLAMLSLFVALQIILTRFCSVQTPTVRLDFNFLAVSMCAAVFGPVWGGIAAAVADFLGVMLFSAAGAFFPGFTVSMFLTGAVYGLFLYNREKNYFRITCAVLIIMIFFNLALNTYWLMLLTGEGYVALLPQRLFKCIVMTPIEIFLIRLTWNTVGFRLTDGRQAE